MYKLALLDIDGTLLNRKGQISKRTIETIQEVHKNGGIVTICTGRNIQKTLPVASKAGIRLPFACIDGTLVYDPVKKQVLRDFRLQREQMEYILDLVKNKDVLVEISDGYQYYKYAPREELYQYDIYNERTLSGRIRSWCFGVRYVTQLEKMRSVQGIIYQMAVAGEEEVIQSIKNDILQNYPGILDVRDHILENYLYINFKGVQKSKGMEELCQYFGVSPKETIAIGDERNDIDMLERAGMGIAMGNAKTIVKNAADYITLSNEEDGVAAALEKFMLEKRWRD